MHRARLQSWSHFCRWRSEIASPTHTGGPMASGGRLRLLRDKRLSAPTSGASSSRRATLERLLHRHRARTSVRLSRRFGRRASQLTAREQLPSLRAVLHQKRRTSADGLRCWRQTSNVQPPRSAVASALQELTVCASGSNLTMPPTRAEPSG